MKMMFTLRSSCSEYENNTIPRVPIKKIENVRNRQITFSKRRNGLVKKGYELSVLCDVDVALITFSPSDRLPLFSSSTTFNYPVTLKNFIINIQLVV
ncbi:hypothetical protein Ahy_Scaffold7g108281 [Arachis hypogaea]|uniref:MADS-box domain-containing protein n=1 Tax=Arachis hypogaea TaxID=3818 RepID=A0A444WNJ1_ARAHY|nr:hypothetical protein Ahy_Scaffold7g108281 [Arachis hypogaea]